MNFLQLCDRFPPVLVRLLARNGGRAMSDRQIGDAQRQTGARRIVVIQPEDVSWKSFTLEEFQTFTTACNLNFTNPQDLNRAECYLRKNNHRPTFSYLTKDPLWKSYYLPLIIGWRKSLKQIPPELPIPIRRLLEKLPK